MVHHDEKAIGVVTLHPQSGSRAMDAAVRVVSSFFSLGPQPMEWCSSYSGYAAQLKLSGNTMDIPGGVFPW